MFGQKMNTNSKSEFGQKRNGNKNTFGTKGFNSHPSSALKSVTSNAPPKPALQK
jgi:hypothetical protein